MKIPIVQISLIVLQMIIMSRHKEIHEAWEKRVGTKWHDKMLKYIVFSIPMFIIVWMDVMYSSFSFRKLGVPPSWNGSIDQLLFLFGAYGMIQVLAQDSGMKTGVMQRDTVQNHIVFTVVSIGLSFGITNNHSLSLLATLLYFHMKYAISNNITSPVCFEEV